MKENDYCDAALRLEGVKAMRLLRKDTWEMIEAKMRWEDRRKEMVLGVVEYFKCAKDNVYEMSRCELTCL